jgi:outer membrane protein OmpA-like peptidoglycan-associated protein
METTMFKFSKSWVRLATVAAVTLLTACGMENRQMVNSSPPPRATAQASVYQVVFDSGSDSINLAGQRAIEDVSSVVDGNKTALVTIVGRSDATGGADYNMELSKKRAEAVRDALIATGKIDPTHINTAWTGQERQDVGTYNGVSESGNRVVDIYIR